MLSFILDVRFIVVSNIDMVFVFFGVVYKLVMGLDGN